LAEVRETTMEPGAHSRYLSISPGDPGIHGILIYEPQIDCILIYEPQIDCILIYEPQIDGVLIYEPQIEGVWVYENHWSNSFRKNTKTK